MTIAILSFGAHQTLINTLESYKKFQLPFYDHERVIFFQAISDEDVQIAKKYGYDYIGAATNVGIAEGYRRLVEYSTGGLFLFLENDWELLRKPSSALSDARFLLASKEADIVKLRNRWDHGWPLWSKQFEGKELSRSEFLLDSVHWRMVPDEDFPKHIKRIDVYGRTWYTTTSQYANWSNNPHFARTEWIRDNVLPQIGTGDIERHMQLWWQQQEFKVAQGEGLFKHNRLD